MIYKCRLKAFRFFRAKSILYWVGYKNCIQTIYSLLWKSVYKYTSIHVYLYMGIRDMPFETKAFNHKIFNLHFASTISASNSICSQRQCVIDKVCICIFTLKIYSDCPGPIKIFFALATLQRLTVYTKRAPID